MKVINRTRPSKKTGLPPGTLIYIGEKKSERVRIDVFEFDRDTYDEKTDVTVEECSTCIGDTKKVTWINVTGLHDVGLMESIRHIFGIHPLIMEDILNTEQRPKLEDLEDSLFLVLKMVRPLEKEYGMEQISAMLKENCVITFQEQKGDVFESVRARIRKNTGRIRKEGADYLLYALVDSIVDGYFPYLEYVSESLDTTEEKMLEVSGVDLLQELHLRKREIILIRKNAWPMREVINTLVHGGLNLVTDTTNLYLKDVHDHVMQIAETTESLRDVVTGLLDLYLSTASARTNDVMKVLTIIATIFIPLTFIAGIYGMNFVYMPELTSKAGYPAVLSVMAIVAGGMLLYFKKKKWL
mgnify:CR=1 FL=1